MLLRCCSLNRPVKLSGLDSVTFHAEELQGRTCILREKWDWFMFTYQVVWESKGPLPSQQSYWTLLGLLPQPHQCVVDLSRSQRGSALEPPQPVKALGLWALVSSHQSLLALFPLLPPLHSRQKRWAVAASVKHNRQQACKMTRAQMRQVWISYDQVVNNSIGGIWVREVISSRMIRPKLC